MIEAVSPGTPDMTSRWSNWAWAFFKIGKFLLPGRRQQAFVQGLSDTADVLGIGRIPLGHERIARERHSRLTSHKTGLRVQMVASGHLCVDDQPPIFPADSRGH